MIEDYNIELSSDIKVIRKSDNHEIYKFESEYHGMKIFKEIGGYTYFFSSKNYEDKIIVNCDLEKVYEFKTDFIWNSIVTYSNNGRFVIICGCKWAFPYECQIYDIQDLNNIVQVFLSDLEVREEFSDTDERNDYYLLSDALIYEFTDNNTIEVKYKSSLSKKIEYFNTYKIIRIENFFHSII
jgi:hypothetical protein